MTDDDYSDLPDNVIRELRPKRTASSDATARHNQMLVDRVKGVPASSGDVDEGTNPAAESELSALRAENEALREALKPFADAASEWDAEDACVVVEFCAYDPPRMSPSVSVETFRIAREALTRAGAERAGADPRCCLNLSPQECATVPGSQCSGLRETQD